MLGVGGGGDGGVSLSVIVEVIGDVEAGLYVGILHDMETKSRRAAYEAVSLSSASMISAMHFKSASTSSIPMAARPRPNRSPW